MPDFSHKVWQGWPDQTSIYRRQSNEILSCNDSSFINYVCVDSKDYQKIYEGILKCKEWEK